MVQKTFVEQPRILPANCEVRPPSPVPASYQPAGSMPRLVADGDNWYSVAQGIMDAKELIRFNFQTNHPPHVNWYLHNYVGCTRVSSDKSNFSFSTNDRNATWTPRAGLIYLPLRFEDDVIQGKLGCQDLVFTSHFYANSLVDDLLAIAASEASGRGLLTTRAAKLAGKLLEYGNLVWLITGVLGVHVEGYPTNAYFWKFGGLLAAKNVPLTGSTNYSTHSYRMRFNLDVLDPRSSWNHREVSFTLTRWGLGIRVHKALRKRIAGDYRPFPDAMPTVNRDLTLQFGLRQAGPLGLQTTLPGFEATLVPLGYAQEHVAWLEILKLIQRLAQLKK